MAQRQIRRRLQVDATVVNESAVGFGDCGVDNIDACDACFRLAGLHFNAFLEGNIVGCGNGVDVRNVVGDGINQV